MSLGHFPKLRQWGIKQAPSSLTAFRLLRTGGINQQQVADLLALMPKLEALHLGWNEVSGPRGTLTAHPPIDFAEIKAALDPLSQHLKTLSIGVTNYRPKSGQLAAEDDPTRPFIEWADSSFGSLASLGFLEHLEVSVNILLDFVPWIDTLEDVLPKSLRSLVLTDETLTWRQGILEDLLQPWEHGLHQVVALLGRYLLLHEIFAPHLTSVTLDFTAAIGSDGTVPRALERRLRGCAEANHVTVKILYVQAYPLEYSTRLYPIALTIYNRQTPKVAPMIRFGGPLTRVPLYWCPRSWSRSEYAYRFPMQKLS
jgi:hypothetical protein